MLLILALIVCLAHVIVIYRDEEIGMEVDFSPAKLISQVANFHNQYH